jgi:predicted nucleic acid-binding protein
VGDTIILDTNVLTHISRGNQPVADALSKYLKSGDQVFISRAAYDELVTRAPTPQMGGQYREMLNDLHIQIAPPGAMADRIQLIADNIELKPAPGKPGQIREYDRTNDPTKPGDAFVAAQTKALNGKLFTLDDKFAKRANQLGIQLVPECKLPVTAGTEDPNTGRKLLGLNPKTIRANGQVQTAPSRGGGTAGTFSVEGVADNTLPEFVGPSPKGEAIIGGIQLAFEGINFVLNLINDRIQEQKVEAALQSAKAAIGNARVDNPRLGILLMFYYTQIEAPSESIIKPGAVFHYLDWGLGVTADEARRDATGKPSISQGTGPNERKFFQEVWIPPLQKSSVTTAKCPFPPIAVGQFFLGNSTKAKFQLVDFDLLGGFDDAVERNVDLPKDTNATFAVLKPPSEVYWYNINGRQTVSVPLKDAKTANGNTIKVVDLDPWSPFHAMAAMVFPTDEWCEKVFNMVRPTDNYQQLPSYVNFNMVRWIRAENIHLLKFL